MKYLAVVLSMLAIGLYTWPLLSVFLNEQDDGGSLKKDVFPQAMMDIQPVGDVWDLQKELAKDNTAQTNEALSEYSGIQEKASLTQIEQPSLDAKQSEPVPVPQGICLKLGPIRSSQLPTINQSVEQSNLLENVSVEPIFGPDHWVVFLIPSHSLNGAQSQAEQMRKKGYKNARVIETGPLMNGVSLGSFSEKEQAMAFYKQVKNKTQLQALRVTRMIGEPTNQVFLMFTNLSQEQARQVQKLGQRHSQKIVPCF